MSAKMIKTQSNLDENLQQICRLCLSEELLMDIFKQDDLNLWIFELLSIVVAVDDKISRFICVICRARIHEFRDYKLCCLEVQDVLQSNSCTVMAKNLLEEEVSEEMEISHEKDPEQTINVKEELLLSELDVKSVESEHIDKETNPARSNKYLPSRRLHLSKSRRKRCKTMVKCTICGEKVLKARLEVHQNKHKGVQPYRCERGCENLYFNYRQNRLQHYRTVHNEQHFECKICPKLFRSKNSLKYHNKSEHQLKTFVCSTCNKAYATSYLLIQHMKSHNSKKDHVCSICSYSTHVKQNLTRHLLMHERIRYKSIEDSKVMEN